MSVNNVNYYQILRISKDATKKDITIAYRKLSLIWHPDKPVPQGYTKEQQTSKFQQIAEAYETLSDEEKRKNYDLGKENGVGSNDWWKNKANSMLGENIDKLKELFVSYGANESDLDPKLWAPFASWEDKVWSLFEENSGEHRDFMELLREESQKAGAAKKKSNSPVKTDTSEPKEIEDKKDSKFIPDEPYRNQESPKKSPININKGIVNKIEIVNDNKKDNQDEPAKNNQKIVIELKNISKITLTSKGELVIEFNENNGINSTTINNEQLSQNKELQKAKEYLQKENRNSLSQQEFNSLVNSSSTSPNTTEKPNNSYTPWIISIGVVLVVGLVIGVLVSRKKSKRKS